MADGSASEDPVKPPYRVVYRRAGVATIADRATDEVLGRVSRDEGDGLWVARTWAAVRAGSTANLPGKHRTRHEAAMTLCHQASQEALGAPADSSLVSSATPGAGSAPGQPGAAYAGIEGDRQ